jgi:hypothetical protein
VCVDVFADACMCVSVCVCVYVQVDVCVGVCVCVSVLVTIRQMFLSFVVLGLLALVCPSHQQTLFNYINITRYVRNVEMWGAYARARM